MVVLGVHSVVWESIHSSHKQGQHSQCYGGHSLIAAEGCRRKVCSLACSVTSEGDGNFATMGLQLTNGEWLQDVFFKMRAKTTMSRYVYGHKKRRPSLPMYSMFHVVYGFQRQHLAKILFSHQVSLLKNWKRGNWIFWFFFRLALKFICTVQRESCVEEGLTVCSA